MVFMSSPRAAVSLLRKSPRLGTALLIQQKKGVPVEKWRWPGRLLWLICARFGQLDPPRREGATTQHGDLEPWWVLSAVLRVARQALRQVVRCAFNELVRTIWNALFDDGRC